MWSATGTTKPRNAPTWPNHSTTPHIPNRAEVTLPATTTAIPFKVTKGAKCFSEAHTSSGDSVPQSSFDLHRDDSDDSLIYRKLRWPITLTGIRSSLCTPIGTSDLLKLDSYRTDCAISNPAVMHYWAA